jgi:hypothetical protein
MKITSDQIPTTVAMVAERAWRNEPYCQEDWKNIVAAALNSLMRHKKVTITLHME